MDNAPLTGLLGLARRAGKAELGEEAVLTAALAHRARLILLAADAADNTVQKLERSAQTGNAVCLSVPLDKARLGAALGWQSCAAVALTDVGLAAAAVERLAQTDPTRYAPALEILKPKAEKTARRRREKLRAKRSATRNKP